MKNKSITKIIVLFNLLTGFLLIADSCISKSEEDDNEYIIYQEATDPNPIDSALWSSAPDCLQGSFGSTDIRYEKSMPPEIDELDTSWEVYAWRGERKSTQLLLWSQSDQGKLSFEWSVLKSKTGQCIPASELKARFVRYVLTDEYGGGCDTRIDNRDSFNVSLVEDVIDEVSELDFKGYSTRPVWISIDVPSEQEQGLYSGNLIVISEKGARLEFQINLTVAEAILPAPSEWSYHLDLWQNPFAVARFHGLDVWSEEHFHYLEPVMKMLADAGQKVITATLINQPWGGQTEDPFQSMIEWRKKADGSWVFDYSVFDKWVEFAEKCGISKQIDCYSMIPWGNKFFYFDEEKNCMDSIIAISGTEAFEKHWEPFLLDFSVHLKQKGWFEKTEIAMDERPVKEMQKTIAFISQLVPGMKIQLAGGYHPEIEKDLFDMCVTSNELIPEDVVIDRDASGKVTTFYTCCDEAFPNTFTFSPPAEATWLAWYAASKAYSGYLRWAYNSWVVDPLRDSRFINWPAGDTYIVYPEARTSIRFEKLREGIQDAEKIRIIRDKLKKINTPEADDNLQLLNEHLKKYDITALKTQSAETMLKEGKLILDQISQGIWND